MKGHYKFTPKTVEDDNFSEKSFLWVGLCFVFFCKQVYVLHKTLSKRCYISMVLSLACVFSWLVDCCYCLVAKSYLILWDLMDCNTPGFSVLHYLLTLAQTHVHWVSDVIQPSRPLSDLSTPALSLSQHQSLFQWVSSLHKLAKVLELQLKHILVNIQGWLPLVDC